MIGCVERGIEWKLQHLYQRSKPFRVGVSSRFSVQSWSCDVVLFSSRLKTVCFWRYSNRIRMISSMLCKLQSTLALPSSTWLTHNKYPGQLQSLTMVQEALTERYDQATMPSRVVVQWLQNSSDSALFCPKTWRQGMAERTGSPHSTCTRLPNVRPFLQKKVGWF